MTALDSKSASVPDTLNVPAGFSTAGGGAASASTLAKNNKQRHDLTNLRRPQPMLPRPIIDELSIILGRRALRYETERPRDSGLSVRTRKEALVI